MAHRAATVSDMSDGRCNEPTLDEVAAALDGAWAVNTERDLHDVLALRLAAAGLSHVREARLSDRDRVDLLVGRVAVEVKVAGGLIDVLRQCQRYARSEQVDSVALVTTVHAHRSAPLTVGGKPLRVLYVGGGWLA